jgi:PAS domain S-box-containing protein
LLGPQLKNPVVTARRTHRISPLSYLVLMADGHRAAELHKAVSEISLIGSHWSITMVASDNLVDVLRNAVLSVRQRQQLRTTLDCINVQLASKPPADAEEQRRYMASDRFLACMLENASDAIVATDNQGTITAWNRAAEQLFSLKERDAIGQSVQTVAGGAWAEQLPGLIAQLGAGRPLEGICELPCRRPDSAHFDAELLMTPVREETGRQIGILAIVRDVTERKRAEERFRRVVEGAPCAMVMVGTGGQIVLVNRETERLFGYAREELVGQSVERLVPERYRVLHPGHRARFFGDPQIRPMGVGRDLHGLRKDGVEVPVEIGLNPLETSEGVFVLASIVDITERKAAQAQAKIEAALAEKTALLKEVHHRVKNNLQIIAGLLFLQAGQSQDPQLKGLLDEGQNRVKTMALIHELLYESRDYSKVHLDQFLQRLTDLLWASYAVDASRIALRLDLHDICVGLNQSIPCGLLVNELLTNALKHAFPVGHRGEVSLELHWNVLAGQVVLRVGDNGVGMPPGVNPEVAKTLGLKLAWQLADQIGGVLRLCDGPGTRFELRFSP